MTAPQLRIKNLTINVLSSPPPITHLGELLLGVRSSTPSPERFELSADGLYVTDHHSGLMWATNESEELDWDAADAFCKSFTAGAYYDWRLATDKEWETLIDRSLFKPCIPPIFKSNNDLVWTATQTPWTKDKAGSSRSFFYVYMGYGDVYDSFASSRLRARPVRRVVPAGQ